MNWALPTVSPSCQCSKVICKAAAAAPWRRAQGPRRPGSSSSLPPSVDAVSCRSGGDAALNHEAGTAKCPCETLPKQ